jgi:hypothetical protein
LDQKEEEVARFLAAIEEGEDLQRGAEIVRLVQPSDFPAALGAEIAWHEIAEAQSRAKYTKQSANPPKVRAGEAIAEPHRTPEQATENRRSACGEIGGDGAVQTERSSVPIGDEGRADKEKVFPIDMKISRIRNQCLQKKILRPHRNDMGK